MSFRMSALLLTFLVWGCSTTPSRVTSDVEQYLHDDLFPNHLSAQIETSEDVFALSEEMKLFISEHVMRQRSPVAQLKTLSRGIFEHSDIGIMYQNDANTVAAETFANGTANCLSLTIMTYALADHAGFGVDFQQVNVPEFWIRRQGSSILNRHINLKLYQKGRDLDTLFRKQAYTIDFNQVSGTSYFSKNLISKPRVLSLFYNNKGVDYLLVNDFDTAYAYFKKGIMTDPLLSDSYTNLGVLYRKVGQDEWAEKIYQKALTMSPGDNTTLENLSTLYRATDRASEAEQIDRVLMAERRANPYYHFLLGEQALEQRDLNKAESHFTQAIKLHSRNHEFYFAMARTMFLMGNNKASQRYMNLALRYSESESDELRYQYKLNSYSQLDKRP
ncbi:MAG: tetratricopeptide repeat protein [Gammaproteobacteria bacterium]